MPDKKYHHGDLKLALIETGIKILDREGYEAFSLRKVAKECDVSQTAPYRHFRDKDDLLQAIIMHVMEEFNLSLEQAVKKYPDDPKSQLKEMGVAYIRFFVENPEYLRLIFLNDKRNQINKLSECLEEGSKDGHPFATFFSAIELYLNKMGGEEIDKDQLMLYSWGLVHGIAILIANSELPYTKDYMAVAEKLLWNEKFLW